MRYVIAIFILSLCAGVNPALVETQVFTDTVRVVMGSRESQDDVRFYAVQEAKRRVLERVGVYLSSSDEVIQRVHESEREFRD